jgi:hypothetical protein
MAHPSNLLQRISLSLTLSSAIAFIFVSFLASSQPSTSLGRLADWTGRTIGHSGRDWFLTFFAAFSVPIIFVVGSLPRRLTSTRRFAEFCATVGFVAVPACYWTFRLPLQFADIVMLLALALMLFPIAMQGVGKWPTSRRLFIGQITMYFALLFWLFGKYMYLPILVVIPIFAFSTCLIWALGVPIRFPNVQSD